MGLEDDTIARFRSNPSSVSPEDLRTIFGERLPDVLSAIYKTARSWRLRNACVWYSTGYCRRSESAIELGKWAIFDRSKFVRYRATELLACSLKMDALPILERALAQTTNAEEVANLSSAIDAITCGNHMFFWDRDHTGRFTVNFEAPVR